MNLLTFFLFCRYGTDIDTGLDKGVADELLEANGPNCLVAPPSRSKILILAGYIFGGFNLLLWMGVILSFTGYALSYSQSGESSADESLFLGKSAETC